MILAIFFMMVISFMAYAYLGLVPSELRSANRFALDNEGSLVADAGIQDTMAWLRQELDANREPFPSMTSASYTEDRNGTLGDWTWRVHVMCEAQTYPRGGATAGRIYFMRSIASYQGTPVRQVETWVQTGESLARWAWLLDSSVPNLTAFPERFEGPVHVNGSLGLINLTSIYGIGGLPVFKSGVEVSGVNLTPDGVSYDSNPYDAMGNPIPARYNLIYQGGRPGLSTGVAKVEFPNNAAPQAKAAWNNGAFPTTPGVYLNQSATIPGTLGAGVYIVGDVDEMVLAVDGGNNSVMTVTQGANIYSVTEVSDTAITSPGGTVVNVGDTLVVGPGATETVYSGLPNGMVYGTGDINSLYGTNRRKRTIAVDMANDKDIRLTHNLLRADTTPGNPPVGTADTLGLVAQNVRVADFPLAERGNMMFYAAILAGKKGSTGGLLIENTSVTPAAYFKLFGSHVEAYALGKGTVLGGATSYATAAASGYWPRVVYDSQLATDPPPFYPTSGGKCRVISWKEQALVQ